MSWLTTQWLPRAAKALLSACVALASNGSGRRSSLGQGCAARSTTTTRLPSSRPRRRRRHDARTDPARAGAGRQLRQGRVAVRGTGPAPVFQVGDGVYLWDDPDGGWAVRATHTGPQDTAVISGTLTTGGKFVDVRRAQAGDDIVAVSGNKRTILFRFVNYGWVDGFDFATRCSAGFSASFYIGGSLASTTSIHLGGAAIEPVNQPVQGAEGPGSRRVRAASRRSPRARPTTTILTTAPATTLIPPCRALPSRQAGTGAGALQRRRLFLVPAVLAATVAGLRYRGFSTLGQPLQPPLVPFVEPPEPRRGLVLPVPTTCAHLAASSIRDFHGRGPSWPGRRPPSAALSGTAIGVTGASEHIGNGLQPRPVGECLRRWPRSARPGPGRQRRARGCGGRRTRWPRTRPAAAPGAMRQVGTGQTDAQRPVMPWHPLALGPRPPDRYLAWPHIRVMGQISAAPCVCPHRRGADGHPVDPVGPYPASVAGPPHHGLARHEVGTLHKCGHARQAIPARSARRPASSQGR